MADKGIIVITKMGEKLIKEYLWGNRAEDYLNELKPPKKRLSKFVLEVLRKLRIYK